MLDIVFGYILGLLIGILLVDSEKYVGPASSDIKKLVYRCKKTGECYKLSPKFYICPISVSMSI